MSPDLVKRILGKMGLTSPPEVNINGLRRLYAAWCMHVPFDNIRKMTVLRTGDNLPLPAIDAVDFFETWLRDGSGATCWPVSNALYELVHALGFSARRIVCSMRDMGIPNHASTVVLIDGKDWLLDSSLLFNVLLPLDGGVFIHPDPIVPVEVEQDDGSYLIWSLTPPVPAWFCFRILEMDSDHDYYVSRYEASREKSIFNNRLYVRRNFPGKLLILHGNTMFTKTSGGVQSADLSREELCNTLKNEIGISEKLIKTWIDSGSLEASFVPPDGMPPPPAGKLPPSMR